MKINMKLVGVSALALVLCGCGGGSGSAEKYAGPKVAEGAVMALEFNQQQIDKIQTAALGEKGESLTKKAWEDAPKEVVEVIKAAGLENAKARWGVFSMGELALQEDMELKAVPEVAVAIAVDIDIEKAVAAVREQQKKEKNDDVMLVDASVAGVKAWKVVDKGGELAKAKAEPCFTALDGKLFLAASTLVALEKQIALYRDGKGASSAFAGFAFADGDLFRLKLLDIGATVKKAVPKPEEALKMLTMFVPNVDKMLLGLGALDLSATATADNGVTLALQLAAASEKDADQLRTLAKTGLMPLTAQLQESAKKDADAKRQLALVEGLKIAGAEGKFEATLTVSGALLKEFAAEAAKELK
jgi:hypothetical protein